MYAKQHIFLEFTLLTKPQEPNWFLGVKGTYDDSDRVSKTTNGKTTESILDNGSVSADLK